LKVYDILGREVETLVNEFQQAGVYEVQFPGSSGNAPASGIYFYKITAGDYSAVKRMVMIK
ncbi:MAG: T9SS type A sorting domain-containing protein, partial [Ignavibacteriae bacterium]|nr:T9SS type A sorting domain-containing protein [Ignavibacteriota bacterium]